VLNFTCSIRRPLKVPKLKTRAKTEKPFWYTDHPVLALKTGDSIFMNVGYEMTTVNPLFTGERPKKNAENDPSK